LEEDGPRLVTSKDPFPLIFFWARRAAKNGNESLKDFLETIESVAHAKCSNCGKPDPQSKCSKCRSTSYCDKTCQTKAWKEGHKVVCNGLPKLETSSVDECSLCGKERPGFTCQRCGEANYCNTSCQKAHWHNGHKDVCKFL